MKKSFNKLVNRTKSCAFCSYTTQRGRLIGQEAFQKQIEAMTGKRLMGEAHSRPKKISETSMKKVL
jgi:hypothetical protein